MELVGDPTAVIHGSVRDGPCHCYVLLCVVVHTCEVFGAGVEDRWVPRALWAGGSHGRFGHPGDNPDTWSESRKFWGPGGEDSPGAGCMGEKSLRYVWVGVSMD